MNGLTPLTGWLMLREMRKSRPRDPKYPTIAARFRVSCRCTLTFQERSEALRNPRSTVAGAIPAGRVDAIALLMGIEPAAVSGTANGGLAAVSLTAVVPG